MDQLTTELVEAQKTRSDLLKWKIVLVAGLASVGFGLSEKTAGTAYADLALCCIPVVCAYVDVLCRHLSLRIFVIGRFRQKHGAHVEDTVKEYENFVDQIRKWGAFSLENSAVFLATAILSITLVYLPDALRSLGNAPVLPHGEVIEKSGWFGLAIALTVEVAYRSLRFVVRSKSEA